MTAEGEVGSARSTAGRRPKRAFVIAAIAYVALAGVVGGPLVWPIVAPDRMLVIGHSGDVANWPRNTLDSVVSASRSGADGLEFDVNRSAEGTWWLFHDENLAATTTGEGSVQIHTDAGLSAVLLDAGMGVRLVAGSAPEGLVRLTDALDALAGYRGVIIVDCKDERPGAHRALAQFLRDRGLITSVIARSAEGAAEIKGVDPRFRVIAQQMITFDPNVDVWLADAGYEVVPQRTTIADLFGELGMFVGDSHWGQDERAYLEAGRR